MSNGPNVFEEERERREERAYIEGSQAAWRSVLQQAVRELRGGGEAPEALSAAVLLRERDEARAALRSICSAYGDNDWPDDLHLRDVIEKHLHVHLDEAQGD